MLRQAQHDVLLGRPVLHYKSVLAQLDPAFQNVLEFRHPSWWDGEIFRLLGRQGISFCGQSHPQPLPDEVIANAPLLYYRLHGVPELYKSSYSPEFLQRLAADIRAAEGVREAYVFFNNGIGGVGALNAREMVALMKVSG